MIQLTGNKNYIPPLLIKHFIYFLQLHKKLGGSIMVNLARELTEEKSKVNSKFNDEFDKYLKRQCLKTTFNGIEIETFSWYKKMLGLT